MPTYLYSFAHAATYGSTALLGAYHAAELPYVFSTFGAEAYLATPAEAALSQAMQDYWGAFAKTGAPAASGQPAWPAFGTKLVTFDFDAAVTTDDLGPGCAMWSALLGW